MRYSTALAEKIAEKVAAGGLPADFLRGRDRDRTLPTLATYRKWRRQHGDFANLVEAALVESAEALVVEMRDVKKELRGECDLGAIRSAEVRLKHLQWLVERMDRERWGPTQKLELTAPPTVRIRDFTGMNFDGEGIDAKPAKHQPKLLPRPKEPVILPAEVIAELSPPRRKRLSIDV